MAFLSDCTACWTRPLEALAAALLDTLAEPRKIFWKASCVPDAAVRTIRSIGPLAVAPGTALQSRTCPEKIAWTCAWETLARWLSGLVIRQIASRAILLNTRPPGPESFGSREESPIDTRPAATSATPMSEPPWAILNFARWGCCLRYPLANRIASGATEVEPLIVMTGADRAPVASGRAEAAVGTRATAAATAEHAPRRRMRCMEEAPFIGAPPEGGGSAEAAGSIGAW